MQQRRLSKAAVRNDPHGSHWHPLLRADYGISAQSAEDEVVTLPVRQRHRLGWRPLRSVNGATSPYAVTDGTAD
ncbi:MAG: hypothetical protein U0992_21750 [Planctomycetaceae bacterium]